MPATLGKTPEARVANLVALLDGYVGKGACEACALRARRCACAHTWVCVCGHLRGTGALGAASPLAAP